MEFKKVQLQIGCKMRQHYSGILSYTLLKSHKTVKGYLGLVMSKNLEHCRHF